MGKPLSGNRRTITVHRTTLTTMPQKTRIHICRGVMASCVCTIRAADALQLAAVFVAAERRPSSLEVITLDERLAAAARKEGFALIDGLPNG